MSAGAYLAVVGADRQIHVVDVQGRRRQLTWPREPDLLSRWGSAAAATREGRAWPTFSPDGRWLACFQLDGASDESVAAARICVTELDGVEEQVLAELEAQLPVYLRWHPDGRHLAALIQEDSSLQLWLCVRDRLGMREVIDEGVPLFFAWDPHALRILIHAGGGSRREGRLMLRDLRPTGEDTVLDAPGSFCAPFFVGAHMLYVTFRGGRSHVCLDRGEGQPPQVLLSMGGLLAVVPDPTGQQVAISVAPQGAQFPYRRLCVLSLADGAPVSVVDVEHQAFFWLPDGAGILLAQSAPEVGGARWLRLPPEGGAPIPLGMFWPGRDQRFYLRFFEQYASSHATISPQGDRLIYAGFPAPGQGAMPIEQIWTLDLCAEQPRPEVLTEGTFGVFAPPSSPR